MSKIPYATAIGSIMHAMLCTQPNVSYAWSITSRYQMQERAWSKRVTPMLASSPPRTITNRSVRYDVCLDGRTISLKEFKLGIVIGELSIGKVPT